MQGAPDRRLRVQLRPTRALALPAALALAALTGCGGSGGDSTAPASSGDLAVVVSAPLSTDPWVGRQTRDGAQLAVDELNAAGGVGVGSAKRHLTLVAIDNAGSPSRAVDAAREAVSRHALALVTDGVGATQVDAVTGPAHIPVFVTFDGGSSVVDAAARPGVYRVAPADVVMGRRLADYVAGRSPRVGLITEGTDYGRDGRDAVKAGLVRSKVPVAVEREVGAGLDPAPQVTAVLAVRPTLLVVWARGPALAAVLKALRAAGSTVPVVTSPTGEDPVVRQAVGAGVDGLTFVSFRITAEVGPKPYTAWRAGYEQRFGVEQVGVTAGGRPVVQPPDWAMFPYDAVQLAAAALTAAGAQGPALSTALDSTSITGANGDEYGFTPGSREGVFSGDIAFAHFVDQRFVPVTDDLLGPTLPAVPQ